MLGAVERLEIFASEEGIRVENVPLSGMKAMSVRDCCACLDYAQIDTGEEETTILAHELGHFMTGSFYNIYTKFDSRAKHEYHADKWAVHKLMPHDDIQEAIQSGVRNDWEMAEYFGVTFEFVGRAMEIYKRCGIEFESTGS